MNATHHTLEFLRQVRRGQDPEAAMQRIINREEKSVDDQIRGSVRQLLDRVSLPLPSPSNLTQIGTLEKQIEELNSAIKALEAGLEEGKMEVSQRKEHLAQLHQKLAALRRVKMAQASTTSPNESKILQAGKVICLTLGENR